MSYQNLKFALIYRHVLKHLNNVLECACVGNVSFASSYESAGNKILICQVIIVQGSSEFQVPSLSVVLRHLSSYTAVRYPTCQEDKKSSLFYHLIYVLPG
jgi:hypothetical protein